MEHLSKEVFKEEMKKLTVIYNYKATQEQMALYYQNLKNKFNDELFPLACKEIILRETFFPAVAAFIKRIPQPIWEKAH